MEKVIFFFSSIRWQDVLDITLNGYILFRLYVLFRGTNAFRVLMGIALLWFLQRISASLGLVVTSWFVQGILAVAALIIIVVFRNEIRAVLQARNLRSIFWGFPRAGAQTPVEILVESVFELARRGIGALIVLPGTEDLSEAAHSGIRWQGLLSAAGSNPFTITPKEVSLPPGVSLRSVEPPVVNVTLDVVIRKDLPVQVDWVGKMPQDRILTQVKVSPERIQVTGPKEILDNMTTLYTEKVPVDNIERSDTLTAQILLSPASLKPAPGARDRVAVEFVVQERAP